MTNVKISEKEHLALLAVAANHQLLATSRDPAGIWLNDNDGANAWALAPLAKLRQSAAYVEGYSAGRASGLAQGCLGAPVPAAIDIPLAYSEPSERGVAGGWPVEAHEYIGAFADGWTDASHAPSIGL